MDGAHWWEDDEARHGEEHIERAVNLGELSIVN